MNLLTARQLSTFCWQPDKYGGIPPKTLPEVLMRMDVPRALPAYAQAIVSCLLGLSASTLLSGKRVAKLQVRVPGTSRTDGTPHLSHGPVPKELKQRGPLMQEYVKLAGRF